MAAVMRKMEESSVKTRPRGSILQMGGGFKWEHPANGRRLEMELDESTFKWRPNES